MAEQDCDWATAAAEEPAITAAAEARALAAQQAAAAALREKELAHMREACRLLREAESICFSIDADGFGGPNWEAYNRWLEADAEPVDAPATHDPREEGIR